MQLATATGSQVITGVDVTNSGGDQGQLAPMVQQHQERYDETPKEALVDGGFVKKADIDEVSPPQGGTTVYAPVMESKDPQRDSHTPRDDDSPAVAAWRQRMATDEAKAIYRERAATADATAHILRLPGTALSRPHRRSMYATNRQTAFDSQPLRGRGRGIRDSCKAATSGRAHWSRSHRHGRLPRYPA